MIGKLSGRLDWRGTDQVLIDVRGVGYIVHVSDRTMMGLPGVGEAVSLYTELLVREDLLQLFGFPTMLEKEWHKLLMTVQGVGAKASMAILGTLGAEGVARAISLGDARAVQSAPGVGPKLAQRVILELKSKAHTVMAMGGGMMEATYNAGPIGTTWSLANLLPGIAIAVRRMHDLDKSGWWILINLIPIVGWIIYIVWACQKGTSGNNRFGADPLAGQAA